MTIYSKLFNENSRTTVLAIATAITSLTILAMNIIEGNKASKIFDENNCTMIEHYDDDNPGCFSEYCESSTWYTCPTKPDLCKTACNNKEYDIAMIFLGFAGLIIACVLATDKPARKILAKLSEMTFLHKKEEKKPLAGQLAASYGTDIAKDIESVTSLRNG